MRYCPVCEQPHRVLVWEMSYKIPDGWPLPENIGWYRCTHCGMLYGDGDFDQQMLDDYYRRYYGYGVNSPDNVLRLKRDAAWIGQKFDPVDRIVDFGGGDGIVQQDLELQGFCNIHTVHVGEALPDNCRLIYASHVLEHIYDLPAVMDMLVAALAPDGQLIIDGPDATGLLQKWGMPILDFNTKHINHFSIGDYINLAKAYGLGVEGVKQYELQGAPAYQFVLSPSFSVARRSALYVQDSVEARLAKLRLIDYPVNVWGMGDVSWHLLSKVRLPVLDYIDNDPAYRGATYDGKPVLEYPTNGAPIVIMAQGQRRALIANIRAAGVTNPIVEV